LGVSGIGWAPAFVALTLYTLLPIGRNTLVGFSSVDTNIIEAAQGMGMNKKEVFGKVLLPLALPIILTGIRIATIQTLGGAVVAGLVGGGGLGSFVFLGLGEASPDLVLLGVIPIVFMTLISDNILKTIISKIRREKP
ncbi:MAG: ABC transporter permease subunit, partial [Clostridium sp.]|nr:ABC transporter permease subunit [Clostridium sp.]